MLLDPQRKKIAQIVVGKLKQPDVQSLGEPGYEPPMEEGPKEDSEPGLKAAADKMISAMHSKDSDSLVSAMKDFLDMHESSEPMMEEME